MARNISPEERKYFERMDAAIRGNFNGDVGKECNSCSEVYRNELEYNLKTEEVKGFTDARPLGIDFGLFFNRNCIQPFVRKDSKVCGTTLTVQLDPKIMGIGEMADFIGYVNRRAHRSGRDFADVVQEVREEYNDYLEQTYFRDIHTKDIIRQCDVCKSIEIENGERFLVPNRNYDQENLRKMGFSFTHGPLSIGCFRQTHGEDVQGWDDTMLKEEIGLEYSACPSLE